MTRQTAQHQRRSGSAGAIDHARIAAHMRCQHGLIERRQAVTAGMTRHRIQHMVDSGQWRRVHSGVYQNCAHPATARTQLLAACMASGGLASHRSAAALHGLDGFELAGPEVVVESGRSRRVRGFRLHRSLHMHLAKPTVIDGIPCTGLARTVLDLAAVVSRRRLEQAVDAALRDDRLSYGDLRETVEGHAERGRDGVRGLRDLLDERCGDGAVPLSQWSRWVSELLVSRGMPLPEMEYRVCDGSGRFVAQVDLAYPARRLAIELDSVRYHLNRESFDSDRRRANLLTAAGWDLLSFTWRDYHDRPDELCAAVAAVLRRLPDSRS